MSGLGILLQEARQEQGLCIEDLAKCTNIRPQFIIAMEADDFEALPGEAYVRPFLRTYAKALGLDVDQVMLEFESRTLPTQNELASMREQRARHRLKRRRQFALKMCAVIFALAGLGYLLYWLFATL